MGESMGSDPIVYHLRIQAVIRPTIPRTHGATTATVGKAIGQVVMQLLSHCAVKPAWIPCEIARTKADTIQTMMAESMALNKIGAKRAGIRILFSYVCLPGLIFILSKQVVLPGPMRISQNQKLYVL
jgi:hypothetical protein